MIAVLQLTKRLHKLTQVIEINGFTIRGFAPSDIQPWLELRHRAFAREMLGVREWTPADFETEFRQRWWWDPAKMWLVETKSANLPPRLVGSVTLAMRGEPASAKPVVHWLMVAPEARRQGLARALMSHLESAAWNTGHREIHLETHTAWQAAARFYETLGYQAIRSME
jgi:GNAT superfamily N-acetyltransferase